MRGLAAAASESKKGQSTKQILAHDQARFARLWGVKASRHVRIAASAIAANKGVFCNHRAAKAHEVFAKPCAV
jgi:hypothetical protein